MLTDAQLAELIEALGIGWGTEAMIALYDVPGLEPDAAKQRMLTACRWILRGALADAAKERGRRAADDGTRRRSRDNRPRSAFPAGRRSASRSSERPGAGGIRKRRRSARRHASQNAGYSRRVSADGRGPPCVISPWTAPRWVRLARYERPWKRAQGRW
jgi:hypothetical protein